MQLAPADQRPANRGSWSLKLSEFRVKLAFPSDLLKLSARARLIREKSSRQVHAGFSKVQSGTEQDCLELRYG